MTQKEAIKQALQMLGGRASLPDIYPLAIKIGDFSGSQDKKATIRNYLQTSPKDFRHSPDKPDGWYELISFQEEISKRDLRIAELEGLLAAKDKEIAEMKKQPTEDSFVKRMVNATKNIFGINRRHADYVRQVLLKLGRDEEHLELLAWIERREQKTAKRETKKIVQKISNSQVFNGSITGSEFKGGGSINEG